MTPTIFAAILLDVATGALPYLAGGSAAAVVILVVWLGISRAVDALKWIALERQHDKNMAALDAYYDER